MADFPSSSASPSDQQAALQIGLAALKRKDYRTAVAQLQQCQTSTDATVQLKAQMGLVKAYVRIGRVTAALDLCQPLCHHPNPQVQAWAEQTLNDLRQHPTLQTTDDPTGFTAFAPAPSDEQTGFVPLDAAAPRSRVSPERPFVQSAPDSAPIPPESTVRPAISPAPTPLEPQPAPTDQAIVPETAISESPTGLTHRWRNAGRSPKWTTLGPVDVSSLWALSAGSLVLLFWLIRTPLQWLFESWNWFSIRLSWVTTIPRFLLPTDLTIFVIGMLVCFWAVSPWLLDWLLRKHHGIQNFSLAQLEAASPESGRLLKRLRSQRQPIPTLKLAHSPVPFSLSYGNLPQTARLVVSQGLLDQLQNDEIAALVAAELAHIRYWDFSVLSTIALLAQLPYRLYWQLSTWGDRQHDRVLQTVAVVLASLSYGIFWLMRLSGLWLSRVRLYYSDRLATEWTGNPNGLTRALLKVELGIAEAMQSETSDLLESLSMLLPIGSRQALTTGSHYNSDASLLEWDRQNPYRHWLAVNNTHPLLGDRLNLLTQYARQWRLESELTWRPLTQRPALNRQRLLLQGAPFFGIPIGFAVAMALWVLGWLGRQVRLFELSWLIGNESVVLACCLLGFSIGLFLRINPSFPDIRSGNLLAEPDLRQLMRDPALLPIDRQPVELTGTLLGRKGLRNWLYRDLFLQTPSGAIRLHYTSGWGWLGDLLPRSLRPTNWIDQTVRVRGWFRRGATPWIDVETMQVRSSSRVLQANHPVWSTILATAAALWAIYILLIGG